MIKKTCYLVFTFFILSLGHGEEIIDGVLDLSKWQSLENFKLDGSWEFYPKHAPNDPLNDASKKYETIPHVWNTYLGDEASLEKNPGMGYGMYRLIILNPPPNLQLSLYLPEIMSAYQINLNGNKIWQIGEMASKKENEKAQIRPSVVRLISTEKIWDLRIYMSNWSFRTGGLWKSISIGTSESIDKVFYQDRSMTYMTVSSLLLMVLIGLIFFILRNRDYSYLHFALFTAAIFLRSLCTGNYIITDFFPGISMDILLRLEYGSGFLALISSVLYIKNILQSNISKSLIWIIMSPGIIFTIIAIIFPIYILSKLIFVFFILLPVTFYFIYSKIIIPSIRQRIIGSKLLLVGSFIVIAGVLNDIVSSLFIIQTPVILPTCMVIYMIFQLFLLASRYVKALAESENSTKELIVSNRRLTQELSDGIAKSYKLEILVAQNEELLKEVHHRVKNSLEIVSAIIKLQGNRIQDSSHKLFYKSLQQRINAISLVHEKLYKQINHALLNLIEYSKDLIELLKKSFGTNNISFKSNTINITAPVEICIDLGLIISELVANSVKHTDKPEVSISVEIEGTEMQLTLKVSDNGPGFPEDFEVSKIDGLGYRLIRSIISRSKGSIEFLKMDNSINCVSINLNLG